MGRFETDGMTQATSLNALADLSGQWIERVHAWRPLKVILLDIESSVSPTFSEQEGTAYITAASTQRRAGLAGCLENFG
jgi:hypothetical protein